MDNDVLILSPRGIRPLNRSLYISPLRLQYVRLKGNINLVDFHFLAKKKGSDQHFRNNDRKT